MAHIHVKNVNDILTTMGYDTQEECMKQTPTRFSTYIHSFRKKTDKDFVDYCTKKNIKNTYMKESSLPVKVTVDAISVHSVCKHHMLPFYGTVCISYITKGFTLGLSKFKRIVDFTSSELTTQEELTQKIVKNILLVLPVNELQIKVECVHSCMIIRGVKDLRTTTKTEIYIKENELGVNNLITNLC
jgi:GTP cyclohydrolase I|tara:strand:+ start:1124 stop:1684 length:561 start_codon:yes stop_codon:yes gene_type:complete